MNISKIHCDGGSRGNPGPAACAFVCFNGEGKVLYKEGKVLGETTNNVAEYSAVILALDWLKSQKDLPSSVPFYLDSQLIVNQLTGKFRIKERKLLDLAVNIKSLEREVSTRIFYNHLLRGRNKEADLLVNQTLDLGEK